MWCHVIHQVVTLPGIVNVNLPPSSVPAVLLSAGRFSIPVPTSVSVFPSIPVPSDLVLSVPCIARESPGLTFEIGFGLDGCRNTYL